MNKLQAGDRAPDFSLPDQNGSQIALHDLRGRKVLLYFYPKANTPGCTTQSCCVRDAEPDFTALKVACLGISPDQPAAQKKFAEKYGFTFPLLADTDHTVAESYGVWDKKSLYGRSFFGIVRSAFLIDEQGMIAAAFYKVSPKDTVPSVKAALKA